MKVFKAKIEDIEKLRPVAIEWKDSCNGKEFSLEMNLEVHLSDLAGLIEKADTDLFLLLKEDEVVGYMGVISFNSPIGSQRIAEEHMWFVSRNNKGRGIMLLIRAVSRWAKEHGCSHIIYNASCLASGMHDRLYEFYEKIGFKKFETSFIKEIT